MLTYSEALKTILSYAHGFGKETAIISAALNRRVLAESIPADRDYPPFNRATMDGFALKFADVQAGINKFQITDTIFAGHLSTQIIAKAQCYRIMTGALVPADADMVIRIEDAIVEGEYVSFKSQKYVPLQSISIKGEDILKAEVYLRQGLQYNSTIAGALAVVGKTSVKIASLPKVALFSSGDELVPVGVIPTHYQIRNSNTPMIKSMLYEYLIDPVSTVHLKDDRQHIADCISAACGNDILILSGAVSAGDADFIPATLKDLGFSTIFHKVGIKPGKPMWFGLKPGGPIVFALPGNPLSSQVTFKLFIEPFLRSCLGLKPLVQMRLPMLQNRIKKIAFDEFFPVCLSAEPYGLIQSVSHTSGDIRAVVGSDGIAWHEAGKFELAIGETVQFLSW